MDAQQQQMLSPEMQQQHNDFAADDEMQQTDQQQQGSIHDSGLVFDLNERIVFSSQYNAFRLLSIMS
jgi:hypothetical protein